LKYRDENVFFAGGRISKSQTSIFNESFAPREGIVEETKLDRDVESGAIPRFIHSKGSRMNDPHE